MIIIGLEMNDTTIDWGAEGGKFPFVFGLNVIDGLIGVEVEGHIINGEIEQCELFKGIIEERAIIGFEMQFAIGLYDVAIFIQKIDVGEAAFCVFIARPRVAEIDINAVDLIIIENLIDVGNVKRGEPYIFEIEIADFAGGGV